MKRRRLPILLEPDPGRVVFRSFDPPIAERAIKIVARIMSLGETEVHRECRTLFKEFGDRHHDVKRIFLARFESATRHLITDESLSEERRLLIGAYFTQEYALEAAALFNPSIVPHPDQSGVPEGAVRFILSLRATGEGHISSIVFRTGMISATGDVELDGASPLVSAGDVIKNPTYELALFKRRLIEAGLHPRWIEEVLEELGETFELQQLESTIAAQLGGNRFAHAAEREAAEAVLALARANYEVAFAEDQPISERVIFPYSPTELKGIEDARFVRFVDENGPVYHATYTAFDGRIFLPQLLETRDFARFRISTLNGPEVRNKGMALFPRKIGDRFAMISRQDNENIYLMYSGNIHFWHEKQLLMRPTFPWEFVQLGNCGSPIETERGWLLLTHGVGYMRKYSIGAALLDLEDPSRVIGRLPRPLLSPNEKEREGYVPNVVYSCGGMVHQGRLILPYALSDQCSSFAVFDLEELLDEIKP